MIYSRCGAPVEILAAEQRTVYREQRKYEVLIHENGRPAKPKGKVEALTGCWYVRAKLAGTYPDGSGKVGEPLFDGTWFSANDLVADAGFREIHEYCERIVGSGS